MTFLSGGLTSVDAQVPVMPTRIVLLHAKSLNLQTSLDNFSVRSASHSLIISSLKTFSKNFIVRLRKEKRIGAAQGMSRTEFESDRRRVDMIQKIELQLS